MANSVAQVNNSRDGSIDVKGQGLRSEKNLILSHSCIPDFFAKGWFN